MTLFKARLLGMGLTRRVRVVLLAAAVLAPAASPLLAQGPPGTARASLLLQRDALQVAFAVAAAKNTLAEKAGAKPCPGKDAKVVDTRFVRERIPIVVDRSGRMTQGAWDEIWVFRFCDRDIQVAMHFDGDGQGGTNFHANPSE